jgi:O-antigen/teichoic acid export membrane protein
MKVYKELAGQTIIYGLGTIIPRILNFLLTPLYTYTLTNQSDFGVITELYSYVAFFMVFLTFGMETTFFRYSNLSENKRIIFNNSFGTLLFTSSVFLFFILFFKNQIAGIIGYSAHSMLIVYLAFIIFFDVITAIPLAKLRNDNKVVFFTVIRTLNVAINIGLNIFFFVICKDSQNEFLVSLYNPEIGVGYAFISNLAASFFTFLILLPQIVKFNFNIDFVILKKMLKYAAPLVIVGLAGMVNEVADKIFLKYITPNYLVPLKQVAIYGANYKLAVLMTIFIQMFKYAAEPFFFKYSENADAKNIYSKIMTWFVIFCLFIFLLVSLNIDIFKYLIGANYRSGLYIVPIILAANMFLGIYYNLSVWYKLNNLTKYGALISLAGVVITVVLNFSLIPVIGYLGSAIATFACYFSMMVISFYAGKRFYKIKYQVKRITGYMLLVFFLFILHTLIHFNQLYINILFSFALILFYLFIVIKVESINFENFKLFFKRV